VLEKMRAWMLESRALKTTTLGGAIRYTMRIWERLAAFVDDPLVWLDNNPTERGLRGPVVGRRNHFGSKSARGTEAAAILYSLVESAKVCDFDPVSYLIEVATRAQANIRRRPAARRLRRRDQGRRRLTLGRLPDLRLPVRTVYGEALPPIDNAASSACGERTRVPAAFEPFRPSRFRRDAIRR
jgi:hypothetical protein